jgi:hypothetical protein
VEKKQNQRAEAKGQIRGRSEADKGQIRYIIDAGLYDQKNRSGTDKEQIRNTTIDPDPKPDPKKKKNTVLKPENVSEQTWEDFLTHRRNKKAPITQTALSRIISQVNKANWNLEDGLAEMINRGWTGFNAEWVNKTPSNKKRSMEEIRQEAIDKYGH